MKDLNKLAQQIHEQNKKAGWWDIPRPVSQTLWLVITELAEATEAERAGKYADLEAFDATKDKNLRQLKGTKRSTEIVAIVSFSNAFLNHIKDTFEDEIADAVIRLLDFAASGAVEDELGDIGRADMFPDTTNETVFFYTSVDLQRMADTHNKINYVDAQSVTYCISRFCQLAEKRGFDLWKHVDLKLKYNATRPKMHGGKKF